RTNEVLWLFSRLSAYVPTGLSGLNGGESDLVAWIAASRGQSGFVDMRTLQAGEWTDGWLDLQRPRQHRQRVRGPKCGHADSSQSQGRKQVLVGDAETFPWSVPNRTLQAGEGDGGEHGWSGREGMGHTECDVLDVQRGVVSTLSSDLISGRSRSSGDADAASGTMVSMGGQG
ncbi:hypothetical protein B0H34DRAFT_723797, partial [Crassisporium funariophilum]